VVVTGATVLVTGATVFATVLVTGATVFVTVLVTGATVFATVLVNGVVAAVAAVVLTVCVTAPTVELNAGIDPSGLACAEPAATARTLTITESRRRSLRITELLPARSMCQTPRTRSIQLFGEPSRRGVRSSAGHRQEGVNAIQLND